MYRVDKTFCKSEHDLSGFRLEYCLDLENGQGWSDFR